MLVEVEADRDAEGEALDGETLAEPFGSLGCSDSLPVGESLGSVLGSTVGDNVGLSEKLSEGASLGDLVGKLVGLTVGLLVGFGCFVVGLAYFDFFIFLFVFIFFDILCDLGAFVEDDGRFEGFDDGFDRHSSSLRFCEKKKRDES